MKNYQERRNKMVERQIVARGVTDDRVLDAMRAVPRERFVSGQFAEFAYDDTPLPVEAGQTISQPFMVALMLDALKLPTEARVLEIGAGSGYAAAVLSRIAAEVYGVERHKVLADLARSRSKYLGYDNVEILCGDGSLGWPEHAPYDAILVSAGAPDVPKTLREQLAIGGRLVVPVGGEGRSQELLCIRRTGLHDFEETALGRVQFVPLIGAEGWAAATPELPPIEKRRPLRPTPPADRDKMLSLIRGSAEPFDAIESADLDRLLERIGDARVVMIGEASHGTSEFYEMRAKITQELILHKGFDIVAIEGDWPDTSTLDRYVRGLPPMDIRRTAFADFPTWMWRNEEMRTFVDWLATLNIDRSEETKVSMHGLDLYSLNNSIGAVLQYLENVDPNAAEAARTRYGCFSPWETDPAVYGRAAVTGHQTCESDAVAMLEDLLAQRLSYIKRDGESFFNAEQNATVIRNAERYYRAMYRSGSDSWNLRDTHMFETLRSVLEFRGAQSKAVVWAHNSHIGNASATEMGVRGELNIGQLVRETYGRHAYSIGFGTHRGVVAAASNWNEPVEFMDVRPSHPDSYERLFHDSAIPSMLLPLKPHEELFDALVGPRLERAIGVIYRPQTELLSHYFQASLPVQFDEYIWFDRTSAVRPLDIGVSEGADLYPFAL